MNTQWLTLIGNWMPNTLERSSYFVLQRIWSYLPLLAPRSPQYKFCKMASVLSPDLGAKKKIFLYAGVPLSAGRRKDSCPHNYELDVQLGGHPLFNWKLKWRSNFDLRLKESLIRFQTPPQFLADGQQASKPWNALHAFESKSKTNCYNLERWRLATNELEAIAFG